MQQKKDPSLVSVLLPTKVNSSSLRVRLLSQHFLPRLVSLDSLFV